MRAIVLAGALALTTTGVEAQQLQLDLDQSRQSVPLDQLETRTDFSAASSAHLARLTEEGRGLRLGVATLQRDLDLYLQADPATRRALIPRLATRLRAEADSLDARMRTIERTLSTPTHRAALAEARRLTPRSGGVQRLDVTVDSVQRAADDLRRVIATLDIVMEDVRNARQEEQLMFDNFDQKANKLFNILSTVLRQMKEMQAAVLRNVN